MALLEVDKLSVSYVPKYSPANHAVREVSFSLEQGDFVGLVGESGSGKSTLGNGIMQLLDSPGQLSGGTVHFDGQEISGVSEERLRRLRWTKLSTVFQSSMASLNPVMTVEAQFRETIQAHERMNKFRVRERTGQLLQMVSIDPDFMRFYPHELSGGMRQRVCLAMALALEPKFVLLDEPTTGLDVVVQREIMSNVKELQRQQGFAVLLISHDLGTVMEVSDRVMVMYAGEIVEDQPARAMLAEPMHPYTRGLLGSYADPMSDSVEISYIPGRPPNLTQPVVGCPFAPRCGDRIEVCTTINPALLPMGDGYAACHVAEQWYGARDGQARESAERPTFEGVVFQKGTEGNGAVAHEEVLRVEGINKRYHRRRGFTTTDVDAVVDVSFTLQRGKVTALVGQSGSGKSTIAKLVTAVERPTSGTITFEGTTRVDELKGRGLHEYRRQVQYVFQDPFSALNPAHPIASSLMRPLVNYRKLKGGAARERMHELLSTVGLTPPEQYASRYPHQLSGGQRQRVVVARALAPEPEIIIADEPISMLDVSIRAEILELLDRLVREQDLAMLYITHDLLSARLLADEILVLNHGRVVEHGRATEVIRRPTDDYTKLLLAAIPNPFATDGAAHASRDEALHRR